MPTSSWAWRAPLWDPDMPTKTWACHPAKFSPSQCHPAVSGSPGGHGARGGVSLSFASGGLGRRVAGARQSQGVRVAGSRDALTRPHGGHLPATRGSSASVRHLKQGGSVLLLWREGVRTRFTAAAA